MKSLVTAGSGTYKFGFTIKLKNCWHSRNDEVLLCVRSVSEQDCNIISVMSFHQIIYVTWKFLYNDKTRLTQPGSLDCRAFVCGTLWRGFDPRQQKVVFGVIPVPQSNTIICKHNTI